jgi:hypothetical protein
MGAFLKAAFSEKGEPSSTQLLMARKSGTEIGDRRDVFRTFRRMAH